MASIFMESGSHLLGPGGYDGPIVVRPCRLERVSYQELKDGFELTVYDLFGEEEYPLIDPKSSNISSIHAEDLQLGLDVERALGLQRSAYTVPTQGKPALEEWVICAVKIASTWVNTTLFRQPR